MKVCIHRGSHQIGGNCVEIATESTRLILDVGQPLEAMNWTPEERKRNAIDPVIRAVFAKDQPVDAILLSHAHADHSGLLAQSPSDVPVWMGKGTSKMLQVGSIYAGQIALPRERQRILPERIPQNIGDITVTGYPVDHSVFGAMAFLIEADGKRVLYSGDLRLHGRKPGMARNIITELAGKLDGLLMEGTHLTSDGAKGPTEKQLEDEIVREIKAHKGLVLACFSPTHVDRLVTFFKATLRSGRVFVADHYTAFVLHMVAGEVPKIPKPSAKEIRVFSPMYQKRIAKVAQLYAHNEISLEEILSDPSRYVMIFRPSMLERDFKGVLPSGVKCIYSYWSGYLDKPDFQVLRAKVAEAGGEFHEHHTSGHIFASDTEQFMKALAPKTPVPIHTGHPEEFLRRFPNARILGDNETWTL